MFENDLDKSLDRRNFLRGSALFSGLVGLSVVPAAAQLAPEGMKEEPEDPFASGDTKETKKLISGDTNEHRNCPHCGFQGITKPRFPVSSFTIR